MVAAHGAIAGLRMHASIESRRGPIRGFAIRPSCALPAHIASMPAPYILHIAYTNTHFFSHTHHTHIRTRTHAVRSHSYAIYTCGIFFSNRVPIGSCTMRPVLASASLCLFRLSRHARLWTTFLA
jgi:hypothetical protein